MRAAGRLIKNGAVLINTVEQALQAVVERDRRDQERKHSPLIQAPDAHLIDNSDLSIEQTVDKLESFVD